MNFEDYLISVALVVLVVRQVRGKKLTLFSLLWPILLVCYAAFVYLRQIPQAGNEVVLTIAFGLIGLVLGVACGCFTKVYRRKTDVVAKATGIAVALWLIGMSGRLIFGLYAQSGGEVAIYKFSLAHHLHPAIWATALIVMALAEVAGRTVPLGIKLLSTKNTV